MGQSDDDVAERDMDSGALEELRGRYIEALKELINERPKAFIEMMCEATLGIGGDGKNPFVLQKDSSSTAASARFGLAREYVQGLATLVLDRVREKEPARDGSGYTPFIDIVAEHFSFFPTLKADDIVTDLDPLAIQLNFFNTFSDTLASAIDMPCLMVFEGVPLYRKTGPVGNFEMLSFDDPLFQYVYKKGEFFETGGITHVPHWVYQLYFKDGDLAAHQAFFAGAPELLDDERDLRRNALRASLGLGNAKRATASDATDGRHSKHRTKLLELTQAVIDRYYGAQFNAADASTITSQKIVVDWLMETHNLSRRSAEAIDIVTRPDSRR